MDYYYYEFLQMLVVFGSGICIAVPAIAITLYTKLKRKKIEEENKTNRLALAYQILAQRPEVSMDEVKELVMLTSTEKIPGIDVEKEFTVISDNNKK